MGDEPLLVIGRQVYTPVGIIDLLALDSNGSGVVIELKRAPSQREAVAQALEYATWLAELLQEDLRRMAQEYLSRDGGSISLENAWQNTFDSELSSASLNHLQRIFIVIEGEHERMVSMVRYLRTTGLDISLLSYNFYRTETGEEILHLEPQVGDTEASTTVEAKPSEARLIEGWGSGATEAYDTFKSILANAGLYAKPKKSGMSFFAETAEGSAFVCFFNVTEKDVKVWIRNDSMKALIDFDQAAERIKQKAPKEFQVNHTRVWFLLRLPATKENGGHAARLIVSEVVDRLGARR